MIMDDTLQHQRIKIVAYWHDPRFSRKQGGLIRMFELADNLTRGGHEIQLFLPRLGYPREQTIAEVIQIPFIGLSFIRPLSFQVACNLALFFRMSRRIDAVYVRQMNSCLPLLIARIFRVTCIYELSNDPFLAYEKLGIIRRTFEKFMDRSSIRLANKVVVLSEWSKERLSRLGGVPAPKIAVMPSGADLDLFRPMDKTECRTNLKLDPSLLYIGFIGSFHVDQGIDYLIDAAPSILSRNNDVRFLLVGDGPASGPWRKKVEELRLGEVFIFSGLVNYRSVPEYIGAMDICVAPHSPSTNQASPVKLFDYMACRRPIVASNIEVVRQIVEECGCAILVEPADTDALADGIITLLDDEGMRDSMADRGLRHVVDNYNRKKAADDLIRIINEKRESNYRQEK
ncbi:glycosyltransferase family 4 protein [Gemmatimonadota bacterium]